MNPLALSGSNLSGSWALKAGGRGTRPPQSKNQRWTSLRNYYILVSFFLTHTKFCIFKHFQNKVADIRGATKFLVWVDFDVYESVPPPQTKLGGDTLGQDWVILQILLPK